MFKVNNRNTSLRCEICSKLTIKIPERRQWRRSGIFIVNFEHIPHLVLVFPLLTLSKWMPAGPLLTWNYAVLPNSHDNCIMVSLVTFRLVWTELVPPSLSAAQIWWEQFMLTWAYVFSRSCYLTITAQSASFKLVRTLPVFVTDLAAKISWRQLLLKDIAFHPSDHAVITSSVASKLVKTYFVFSANPTL